MKKLEEALLFKDTSEVEKLICQGYDISNIDLTTVIGFKKINRDTILLLIENNKNVNVKNKKNETPLTQAIGRGDIEIIKKLLECGANVNANTDISHLIGVKTVLDYAFLQKNLEIIVLLIKNGAKKKESYTGWNAFKKAILGDDEEVYELLHKCQIDIEPLDMSGSSLFYAVINNKPELLEKLIKTYDISNVNYSDFRYKETLLPLAILLRNDYETISLLIDSGININQTFDDGSNALMLATNYMLNDENPNTKIVELLIKNNIDINKKTDNRFTALMVACKDSNSIETIRVLLKNGANINHQNTSGLTSLMCAVKEKNIKICELLIENHANVNIANKQGVTPFMVATWQNDIEIMRLFKEANVDIDAKDNDDYSALTYMQYNTKCDESLLDIFNKKDIYAKFKKKINNIDTNHGIDEKKLKEWIAEENTRHNPKRLMEILKTFSSDETLKYTNHPWDGDGLTYDTFIKGARTVFNKIENDLEALAPSLHKALDELIFSEENREQWVGEDSRGEIQNKIKRLFVIKQDDKNLKLLKIFTPFKNTRKSLNIDLDAIKSLSFDKIFTNRVALSAALDIIFKDISEHIENKTESRSVVVQCEEDEKSIEIRIIHKDSSSDKDAQALEDTIGNNGGNFATIKKNLTSVCDWSIDTICKDGNRYKIDYLYPKIDNDKPHCVKIEDTIQGFTHILRFSYDTFA